MARSPMHLVKRYNRDNISRYAMQQCFRRDTFLRLLSVESSGDTPVFDFILHPDTWEWLKSNGQEVRLPVGKLTAGSVAAQTVVKPAEQSPGIAFDALFKNAAGPVEQSTSGYVGEILGHRLYTDMYYEPSDRITDGYIAIQVVRYPDEEA